MLSSIVNKILTLHQRPGAYREIVEGGGATIKGEQANDEKVSFF